MNICPHCIASAAVGLLSHGCALAPATSQILAWCSRIARTVADGVRAQR